MEMVLVISFLHKIKENHSYTFLFICSFVFISISMFRRLTAIGKSPQVLHHRGNPSRAGVTVSRTPGAEMRSDTTCCCFTYESPPVVGDGYKVISPFLPPQGAVDTSMLNPVSQVIVAIRENTEQLADKMKYDCKKSRRH